LPLLGESNFDAMSVIGIDISVERTIENRPKSVIMVLLRRMCSYVERSDLGKYAPPFHKRKGWLFSFVDKICCQISY
jgi:hypothetical protein